MTPNPLGDYVVPKDQLLGWIAWYTVSDPSVTHSDLTAQVKSLGLDESIIPIEPRVGDAFKRACRYSERKNVPVGANYANFLIRKINDQPDEVLRQLVIEVVDSGGKKLDYLQPARMRLDRVKKQVYITTAKLGDPWDDLAELVLDEFKANFKIAQDHLDAQTLRRTVRRQLDRMDAIAVRRQGSVYFIPAKEEVKTKALKGLLDSWNNDSVFHAFPLVNAADQRAMVKGAFEEEIHSEATELISRLRDTMQGGKTMSSNAYAEYQLRFEELVTRAKDYGHLVRDESAKANDELNALQAQLHTLMAGGIVVDKRKRKAKVEG